MRIAVVGAGGFVGRPLVEQFVAEGHVVVPMVRSPQGLANERVIDDIVSADWPSLLSGVDAVVHLAARVHMMHDTAEDPMSEFRRVNTAGTLALAEAAANVGVKRFIFLSTIKVNGEATLPDQPFRSTDLPQASDPYGISKQEAEAALFEVARKRDMEVTVIRPPLIYGPGVKGNLRSLIKAVRSGIPLPLGGISENRRSLVGIDNLISLIGVALTHPGAANATFLVSDGEDVSTTGLLKLLAEAMGKKPRLLPLPTGVLSLIAGLAGKKSAVDRLVGNLQVDISDSREKLGWTPPVSLRAGLRSAVEDRAI
ncbi:SDR family oxidoreductase [Sphingomonas sp. KR3-1]|uniref:UDP-glucose 4-epimerase family protein n=1 Tax=Sphingomonas sp. KR3-1 TaxID=3156611 RepID=UPI0032B3F5B7